MRNLPEVIADILESRGAAVEKSGENGLDVIASPGIVSLLDVPEYHRLSFTGEYDVKDSLYASYDSDYFRSLERLFTDGGRKAAVTLESPTVRHERIAETLADRLPLTNAAFRLERVEEKTLSYFLVYFRFTALSDDRHDGMFSVLVNPLNASTSLLEDGLESLAGRIKPLPASEEEIPAAEMMEILGWAHRAAAGMVRDRLTDFIRSAERRLNRDVKRVYEYYETLKEEIDRRSRKKMSAGEGAKVPAEKSNLEEMEILRRKREAIEAEREWKVNDLIAKYALGIRNTPFCVLRIQATVPVFFITLKRRLSSRPFAVTYNPLLKRIDALPCESCYHPSGGGGYTICDDKLHIVCDRCMANSPASGRPLCPACRTKREAKDKP
ncbi:MAG: zinc finger, RING-type domain-containing protein [Syntrophales bacterium]|nr:zinc finger, RING-type domain-containing protein [Syntrophales bacterium]